MVLYLRMERKSQWAHEGHTMHNRAKKDYMVTTAEKRTHTSMCCIYKYELEYKTLQSAKGSKRIAKQFTKSANCSYKKTNAHGNVAVRRRVTAAVDDEGAGGVAAIAPLPLPVPMMYAAVDGVMSPMAPGALFGKREWPRRREEDTAAGSVVDVKGVSAGLSSELSLASELRPRISSRLRSRSRVNVSHAISEGNQNTFQLTLRTLPLRACCFGRTLLSLLCIKKTKNKNKHTHTTRACWSSQAHIQVQTAD